MQRLKTHAWDEVHAVESTVQNYAWVYTQAQWSLVDLGADASLLDRYKVLRCQDLKIDTTIIAPNVRGQRNRSLPWFWSMDVQRSTTVGAWMNDCKHISFHVYFDGCSTNLKFKYSLLSALAEGKGSKDMVD
jgi:hypothetical protein